jgi:uncharacterized protein
VAITFASNSATRLDVQSRLRKAVVQNDLALVQRILDNNPGLLQNPDVADKSNTSLHLAAQGGLVDIAVRDANPLPPPCFH